MAGLLAWAADVVTGNGVAGQQDEEEEEEWSTFRRTIHFSADQQEEVRQLDIRAATLQNTIQHLRLRTPPPDISRSLPDLHSDSLAAHSALTSELNAHQVTQDEAQSRESLLHLENAAYFKAILAVRQQIYEKSRERFILDERVQEIEKEELTMEDELNSLQTSLAAEKEARPSVFQGMRQAGTLVLLSTDKAIKEGEELQRTRAELKTWEAMLARLEQEWASLLQNSMRVPSAAHREKELERRLRNLSEQLVTKQVQVDTLMKERNTLEFQLHQSKEIQRQTLLNHTDARSYRTKTTKFMPRSSSAASEMLAEEFESVAFETDQVIVAALKRAFKHAAETLWCIWDLCKELNSQVISVQPCTSTAVRILILLYVLSLHMVAFAVISFPT